jgi:hypothetical protein
MKRIFRGFRAFRGFATIMLAWTLMVPASARAADSSLDAAMVIGVISEVGGAATPAPAAAAEGVQTGPPGPASPDSRSTRIFDATDPDVIPPVAIVQTMPIWAPRADVERRESTQERWRSSSTRTAPSAVPRSWNLSIRRTISSCSRPPGVGATRPRCARLNRSSTGGA